MTPPGCRAAPVLLPFDPSIPTVFHITDSSRIKICNGSRILIAYSISCGIIRTHCNVNSGSTGINRTAANEDDWTTGFPTDATEETISNFREMQTHLHVDEQDLRHMADSLIAKLQQIRDDEFEAALILADETV